MTRTDRVSAALRAVPSRFLLCRLAALSARKIVLRHEDGIAIDEALDRIARQDAEGRSH